MTNLEAGEAAVEEPHVGATAGPSIDAVAIARRRMLKEGWDPVVCLTDLPLLVRRRPVTIHVSTTHGVGLVSVPALGAIGLHCGRGALIAEPVLSAAIGRHAGRRTTCGSRSCSACWRRSAARSGPRSRTPTWCGRRPAPTTPRSERGGQRRPEEPNPFAPRSVAPSSSTTCSSGAQ